MRTPGSANMMTADFREKRTPALIALLAGLALATAFLLERSCTRVPPLRPYDERTNMQYWRAPSIVVGVAEGDSPIGRPVMAQYVMQLHRATVHVENVLRGTIPERTITVYYFTDAHLKGGWDPPRRILLLRKDSGVYRTASDGPKCTMIVLSGAHPGYKADPSAPLFQTIDDILLTRGEGRVDDHEWAKRIFGLDDGTTLAGYIIEKLRSLALTESSEVKYAACQLLWSYDNPPISEDLRERAHDSITSAGCTCDADRFGRVVCH